MDHRADQTSALGAVDAICARLSHERTGVRRVAARDLLSINPIPESACDLVVSRIVVETDDVVRHLLVRLVGALGVEGARGVLELLIADAATPVVVAHEARVSLDRLDLARRRTPDGGAGLVEGL
jgi:hypothetical protein